MLYISPQNQCKTTRHGTDITQPHNQAIRGGQAMARARRRLRERVREAQTHTEGEEPAGKQCL